MKYSVIVNMNIEYEYEAKSAKEAYEMSQEQELPHGYVEDSRDTVKIIREDGEELSFDWEGEVLPTNK